MNFSQKFIALPPSIQKFVKNVVHSVDPKKIFLFGSRARGDHRPNSDFDIAVCSGDLDKTKWNLLQIELHDEPLTLHKVDLVHYEAMSDDYRENIDREGVLLYDK